MTPLVEKYRPVRLEDFAGLHQPRALLSAFTRDPYPSAWLLLGPSGTGKTTIALAVAEAIRGEVHHVPARACDLAMIEEISRMCWYVPMGGGWHVVLIDEADQMTRAAQLSLLSKLDTTAALPNTIFLLTANASDLLEDRFLSRCRVLHCEMDDRAATAALLARIWGSETNEQAPDFDAILEAAKFNVRAAVITLEMELLAPGSFRPPSRSAALPARQSRRISGQAPRLKGSVFTHEQRAAILNQAASSCAAAVCRQHGILPQTLYHWKKASAGAAN